MQLISLFYVLTVSWGSIINGAPLTLYTCISKPGQKGAIPQFLFSSGIIHRDFSSHQVVWQHFLKKKKNYCLSDQGVGVLVNQTPDLKKTG